MTRDPFGDPAFQAALRRELTRIGGDEPLLDGLASSEPVSPNQFLAALRATPTGAGQDEFLANLAIELGRGQSAETEA